MDYDLLLKVWVYGSLPFIVCNLITCYQLCVREHSLLGVHKKSDVCKMRSVLYDFQGACKSLPWWVVLLILVQMFGLVCILDGLLWVLRPYKQLKKMWNVLFWNFVKI